MPSKVVCDDRDKRVNCGHTRSSCRQAAIELAEANSLNRCRCGAIRRYIVTQTYPYPQPTTYEYELVKVIRLRPNTGDKDSYDPMVFYLEQRESGERLIWPFYWTKNRNKRWHVGQFPPLMHVAELQDALNRIGGL